jgi:trehalose 6-phosphate phosphatase
VSGSQAGGAPPTMALPSVATAQALAEAIERLVAAPAPLLVVADFDGTLAAGSRDPGAAVVDRVAQGALRHLARIAGDGRRRVVPVVLTGRTVSDVAQRIRVGGLEYLGDHGLQSARLARGGRVTALRVHTEPGFDRHLDPADRLASGVADALGGPPWLYVERKGPSVAFHVRQAGDVAAARAEVLAAIAAVEAREGLTDHGLAHYRGRSVVDLRPADAGGKREAVERLLARHAPGAVVVLGDELSDVDAFEAVAAARADRKLVGITVAVHGAQALAPAELLACADLALDSPRSVGRFLRGLALALDTRAVGR